jgi:hypothetical protein
MPFTKQDIKKFQSEMSRRLIVAERAGGIRLDDYINGLKDVPDDYVFDVYTQYYIPRTLDIEFEAAKMVPN